jgi:hypothetical protein
MIKCDAPSESERYRQAAAASASHGPSEPVTFSSVSSWPEPQDATRCALSDFAILRRVLGTALRYRRGMAMAADTTVAAALI